MALNAADPPSVSPTSIIDAARALQQKFTGAAAALKTLGIEIGVPTRERIGPSMPGGGGQDAPLNAVQVGHHVPNAAPLYWLLNSFEKGDGSLGAIPAIAGQSQLDAPGALAPRQP